MQAQHAGRRGAALAAACSSRSPAAAARPVAGIDRKPSPAVSGSASSCRAICEIAFAKSSLLCRSRLRAVPATSSAAAAANAPASRRRAARAPVRARSHCAARGRCRTTAGVRSSASVSSANATGWPAICDAKCSASSAMSSRRSRSGGSSISNVHSRKIQIVPKLARLHFLSQVLLRGRNHAEPRPQRRVAADRQHFAMIEHAQQFQLQRAAGYPRPRRETTCRHALAASSPGRVSLRAGQRTSTWPNSSPSASVRTQRRQVHRHERCLPSRAVAMNGRRGQFLADAALAVQQHRRIRIRRQRNLLEHVLHRRRAAQHAVERFGRRRVLARSASTRSARSIAARISARSNGFTTYSNAPLLIASTAVAKSPNAVITMIGAPPELPAKRLHRRQPIHAGQTHVENQARRAGCAAASTSPSSADGATSTSCPMLRASRDRPQEIDGSSSTMRILDTRTPILAKGSSTRNRVMPFSLFQSIDPPWAATTSFATASPSRRLPPCPSQTARTATRPPTPPARRPNR